MENEVILIIYKKEKQLLRKTETMPKIHDKLRKFLKNNYPLN